jgi:hypothetical protein
MNTWRLSCCLAMGTPPAPMRRLGSYLKRTHGAWVLPQGCTHVALGLPSWGLGKPPEHMWPLGSLLGAWAHPLSTRGAWAPCLVPGHTPWAHVTLGLGVTHDHAPLGDNWHLGSATGPKGNGSGVRIQDQHVYHQDPIIIGSSIKTQGSWVLGF